MLTDALVSFVPVGAPLAILGAAVQSNVVDLLGSGVGTMPPSIIGNATLFGEDVGIGLWRPQVMCAVGPAFVGGTSVNVQFQAAPDVAVTHVPTTWTTLMETGAIPIAQLTLNAVIARFDFPPAVPPGLNPRYLRLQFTPVGTFSAGAIAFALVTLDRDDQANRYAAGNFLVS